MSITNETRVNLTPRERAELDWEKEAAHLQIDYAQKIKEMDLEVRRLEVKWTQVFKLPTAIILLPVKLILALAIPIAAISKHDLPDAYWELMRG